MNLRFLETFVCAARLKSFSLAAERMNTSQAAISSRIATLEADLGVKLFERDIKGVRLTASGHTALPRAEDLVRRAADFRQSLADPQAVRGSITIGVIDTITHSWLPELIERIKEVYPRVAVQLSVDTSLDLARELREELVDVALMLGPVIAPGVMNVDLGTFICRWVSSPRLNFPDGRLTLDDIAAKPILAYSRDSLPHQQIKLLLREAGIDDARFCNSNSLATTIRLGLDGLGVGPLPTAVVGDHIAQGALRLLDTDVAAPSLACHAAFRDDPANPIPAAIAGLAKQIAIGFAGRAGAENLQLA